ncbi:MULTISPECIES: NAD(P)/FAD-dependent oxidoreductase [unclassified Saccharibacter]|uniref:NAD(P)/FAD-dependent oxidoreductase n=1 Tax=unclassified Saccharibacter TaxID=2648722 RepID=UPI0013240D84|nr:MULTISPECIES: tryptophan 7-halogenase [unclassified Saccharibacter]MXV36710.1 hypothetical protein [Saccharibacter sp. EH611]MXV58730.1 hypothetical protein [Saccharibacter sp. EH70]MXV65658.1 hypothetical protein [Saccharibacter sp. EH60]
MASYDVTIIGAGFSGLTLAYQLLQNIGPIQIALINDGSFPVNNAAHKVGESVNEVGGLYLSHILKLHDYMEDNHFKKMGMRFFKETNGSFAEMGPAAFPANDSFHFQRGKFENDLYAMLKENVDFFNHHKFVDFSEETSHKHVLFIDKEGKEKSLTTQWVIDASGMKKVLSKKFNITRKLPISHASVWSRFSGFINVSDIYLDHGETPFSYATRERSSIHVEGLGYWIWILPLSDHATSLGIVFDEERYSFDDFSSQEKMLSWLDKHEPLLGSYLRKKNFNILDFKILRKFATLSDYATSPDRWALTGDAYGFWDPYYSGGFDVVAFQNTMLTQIIKSDLAEEDITRKIHNNNVLISSFMELMEHMFNNMYTLKENWYYLTVKYCIDSVTYFGSFCVIMRNIDFSDDILVESIISLVKETISIYSDIASFLRSDTFKKLNYTAPRKFLLHPTLFSTTNMNINTPNNNKNELINILKKHVNIMKYQYYYLLKGYDYMILLHSSIYDIISSNTDIDSYADNPLLLLQEGA